MESVRAGTLRSPVRGGSTGPSFIICRRCLQAAPTTFCGGNQMNSQQVAAWVVGLINSNNVHAFYISKRWRRLRAEVLKEQHGECQICKSKGKYTPADTVHHIKPLRKCPALALKRDNLIALCESCHYEIHHSGDQKNKWNDERW